MKSRQGQSLSTIDKERQIAGMIAVNMRIVRAKCPRDSYFHVDLNAGTGWNDEFGVPGTPMVFVQLAEEYLPGRWNAVFFEVDAGRARELSNRFRGIPRIHIEEADNRSFVQWTRYLSRWQLGSVLADPNGYLYRGADGMGCPIVEMAEFFTRFPRMDLFANINLRHYKLIRGLQRAAALRNESGPNFGQLHPLESLRQVFHKKYGLISSRSNQFVRLVLRNVPTRDWPGPGWHQLHSPAALEIYHWAESLQEGKGPRREDGQMDLAFAEEEGA